MGTATAISLHKVDNEFHKELSKPQWLTYTELVDVERIIKGLISSYHEMRVDRDVEETRDELANRFLGEPEYIVTEKKTRWRRFTDWWYEVTE